MKTKMIRTLLIIAAVLGLSLAPPVNAQQYQPMAAIADGTYTIAATTASNFNGVVTSTKFDYFSLDVQFKLHSAGTSALDFVWSTSNDGTNWHTVGNSNGRGVWTIAANGTTQVNFTTNINMNGVGYWRLEWLTNGNAAVLTNLAIRPWCKPKRTG